MCAKLREIRKFLFMEFITIRKLPRLWFQRNSITLLYPQVLRLFLFLESGLQNKVIYHVVLEAVQSICGLFMTLCHSVLDECRATVVFI